LYPTSSATRACGVHRWPAMSLRICLQLTQVYWPHDPHRATVMLSTSSYASVRRKEEHCSSPQYVRIRIGTGRCQHQTVVPIHRDPCLCTPFPWTCTPGPISHLEYALRAQGESWGGCRNSLVDTQSVTGWLARICAVSNSCRCAAEHRYLAIPKGAASWRRMHTLGDDLCCRATESHRHPRKWEGRTRGNPPSCLRVNVF